MFWWGAQKSTSSLGATPHLPLQALDLSHPDYCSVVWSVATKRDLGKLQLAQNRAARLALGCTQRANINNMHVNLSWLKVEEIFTSSLLVFMRGMLISPSYLFELLAHSSDIHAYPRRHAVSSHSPSPEQTMGAAQYYIEPCLRGTLFHIK
jgi:hypothetical protein